LYPALFPLKWLICIPNISTVRGNVIFETFHDFYQTAIIYILILGHPNSILMFFCQRIKSAEITIVFQDKNMGKKVR
ncbi:MAG: hypothetical protein Q4F52_11330, partial [Bacteroidaceae bacterium]|nr:hypothetical protein [Bacteroidaceae bacterium]